MPMAGAGSRFAKQGYNLPKPLIILNGKPFFYWAVRSITDFVDVEDITFVVLKEHIEKFAIDQKIKELFKDAKIVVIESLLNGALLTSLKGLESIKDNNPILFNDCDHAFLSQAFNRFCYEGGSDVDGALLTFSSNSPKFSYLQLDEHNNVIKTVEKVVVSPFAICGAYYFKNKTILENCSKEYLDNCQYNEYFMSGVYNIMASKGMKIRNFPCDIHVSFGTPEEFKQVKKLYFLKI